MAEEGINAEKDRGVAIPIVWSGAADKPLAFVNHMLAQQDGINVFIQFYELSPPILTNSPEENDKYLRSLPSIEARCVARIVVTFEVFEAMKKALDEVKKRIT